MPPSLGLNLLGVRRHVLMDQRDRFLHVVRHLVFLVLDDLLFEPAATAAASTGIGRRRRCRRAHRHLGHLAVGAVEHAVLLTRFLFALETDRCRLDPLVGADLFRAFREVLFQRRNHLIGGRRRLRRVLTGRERGDQAKRDDGEHQVLTFHFDLPPAPAAATGGGAWSITACPR